jgi:glycine oxidase
MESRSRTSDVVIIGGGIVGLATAFSLSREKLRINLVERGAVGREASWAAAGYLTFQGSSTQPGPRLDLTRTSFQMYPAWLEELAECTPGDTGFWRCGLFELCLTEAEVHEAQARAAWQRAAGYSVEWLDAATTRRQYPHLAPSLPVHGGLFFAEVAQVRPPRLLKTLTAAARHRGVEVFEDSPVTAILRTSDRVTGVSLADGTELAAPIVINAAGSWASQLAPEMAIMPIRPVKGTIVLLEVSTPPTHEILVSSRGSLYPRADNKVLLGATIEDAGYDKGVKLEALRALAQQSMALVPMLKDANFAAAWAGLRPFSHDNLPYLGAVPGLDGGYAAAGHYRSGILLAPITGRLMADIVLRRTPILPLAPYAVTRLLETGGPNSALQPAVFSGG